MTKKGWFQRLKEGLTQSSQKLSTGITTLFTHRKLDQDTLDELEEFLISSDLGVEAASQLVKNLSKNRFNQDVTDAEIREIFASEIASILTPHALPLTIDSSKKPFVILVAGVNGAGKTTTIGKLAKQWADKGFKVSIIAGDTFRAAAVEQLQVWGERAGVPVLTAAPGADASGLAFDGIRSAQERGDDVVIMDTAGRLQNKTGLMDELKKIVRVIQKVDPQAPHATLLVLDATTGQNALSQVKLFQEAVPITGLIMTKLDGTAKGGILVALAKAFGLSIHAIGVGETIDDLNAFSAQDFAESLMDVTNTL